MVDSNTSSADADSVAEPSTAERQATQQSGVNEKTQIQHPAETEAGPPKQVPGTMLGPYRLESKIGEGGMGAVFKAMHTKLGKVVAVKILPAHFTRQKDTVARFEREMLAVGRLTHPHIVQAHDAGEINGTHFIAMEYVDGTDLAQYVKQRGPMSVTNACKAVRQAALALSAAHAQGLIHRDIKPSNMLLAKSTGQIKLLDLGLARLMSDTAPLPELTVAGETFGTPDYMAPEQWENSHTADARSDLYALGCTLFSLLTGRAPYAVDQFRPMPAKMRAHLFEPIPDLLAQRPDVPADVVAIYRKLLAKKPADRFQTAKELAEALQPFASSKPATTAATVPELLPVIATEPAAPPQPPRATNRRALFGGGLGAVALLGVIVIIITNKDGTKTKLEVPAGTQKVEITDDGKTVSTVTPKSKPSVTTPVDPAVNAFENTAKFLAQQREVAEFVLSRGGGVQVTWIEDLAELAKSHILKPGEPVPQGNFVVQNIELHDAAFTGADLARLTPARQVHWFNLASAKELTQADARRLADFSRAFYLGLLETSLKTSWFPELPAPVYLGVSSEMVDDQWAFLGRCPNLLELGVINEDIPDLTPLGQYPQLRWLQLRDVEIAPDVVKTLQERNPRLRITAKGKVVGRDPATESARKLHDRGATFYSNGRLFDAVPQERRLTADDLQNDRPWRIADVRFVDGKAATPDDIREFTAFDGTLSTVTLDQQQNSDELARSLAELGFLFSLSFTNSDLTDAGLAALQRLDRMRYLDVRGNAQITKAGIDAFHKAVPLCRLLNDHGEIPADLVAVPVREAAEKSDE